MKGFRHHHHRSHRQTKPHDEDLFFSIFGDSTFMRVYSKVFDFVFKALLVIMGIYILGVIIFS